jgi:hypothetical protein
VPSTLALLPEYSSVDDPIAELRAVVQAAVAWLVSDGPAKVIAGTPSAERIGAHLLGGGGRAASASERSVETTPNLLVVANGSATRTEKAPGHFDERAAAFDAAVGKALAAGDPSLLPEVDEQLARDLWAWPDVDVLARVLRDVAPITSVQVDYDDAPFGVQYWVVRWQCL